MNLQIEILRELSYDLLENIFLNGDVLVLLLLMASKCA